MKKVISLVAILLILCTGCAKKELSVSMDKIMQASTDAISKKDYSAASAYGKLAIDNGCEDAEFKTLIDALNKYVKASAELEKLNFEKVLASVEKIPATDNKDLKKAIDNLKAEAQKMKDISEKYNPLILEAEENLKEGFFKIAFESSQAILENEDLLLPQREKIEAIFEEAEEKYELELKKAEERANEPPKMYTEQEAIAFAKKAYPEQFKGKNSIITATLEGNEYRVSVTTEYILEDGSVTTDEFGCTVDAYTGKAYNPAG